MLLKNHFLFYSFLSSVSFSLRFQEPVCYGCLYPLCALSKTIQLAILSLSILCRYFTKRPNLNYDCPKLISLSTYLLINLVDNITNDGGNT